MSPPCLAFAVFKVMPDVIHVSGLFGSACMGRPVVHYSTSRRLPSYRELYEGSSVLDVTVPERKCSSYLGSALFRLPTCVANV